MKYIIIVIYRGSISLINIYIHIIYVSSKNTGNWFYRKSLFLVDTYMYIYKYIYIYIHIQYMDYMYDLYIILPKRCLAETQFKSLSHSHLSTHMLQKPSPTSNGLSISVQSNIDLHNIDMQKCGGSLNDRFCHIFV